MKKSTEALLEALEDLLILTCLFIACEEVDKWEKWKKFLKSIGEPVFIWDDIK